ncbi:HLA class II histocompatibility antigen, DP alpha 1 chain-like isoform X2 [Hemicordylus capensis]|uniref:HLA class II histocompatibility antigen, DP alpha 1 chain-like isoform X1 n=1 Tax=Hemicordylus capensis TaxID=884348 RepID=UPI002303CBA5|nr:HLA class II histocompatibility antigen, DP alpha 1 chain-like isoform X1 [Hemicordylus capensis]XP_053144115.1 HLA class II histocompatibility antigen, DP alpha 1 chain-like isoform X2 [Hemicordylus capensis]
MDIIKNNTEVPIKRSNRSQTPSGTRRGPRRAPRFGGVAPPTATVFPKNPVEMGDPNVLVCFMDQFFPPVLNITWLKNREEVSQGVTDTDFFPSVDNAFRKFSYLAFVPQHGDVYICQVDHWGLPQSLAKLWHSKEPTLIPETKENVVCGLGLAMGLLGIIAGTVLFFKARRMNGINQRRGPL